MKDNNHFDEWTIIWYIILSRLPLYERVRVEGRSTEPKPETFHSRFFPTELHPPPPKPETRVGPDGMSFR